MIPVIGETKSAADMISDSALRSWTRQISLGLGASGSEINSK